MASEPITDQAIRDTTGSGGDLGVIRDKIQASATEYGAQAKQAASTVRDEAVGATADIKDEVSNIASAAREKAMSLVDQQKQAGAEQAAGLARAIHRSAEELQESSPALAQHVREAAAVVSELADTLRDQSLGELIGQAEGIARRQPVAFFGVAALAGFALSRFVKSSSRST